MNIARAFRDGSYLTHDRMRLWSIAFIVGFICAIAGLFLTAHSVLDYQGRPLGSDFSNVYAAGDAALRGHPTLPFNPLGQYRAEQLIFGANTQFYGWHYPPYFLLIAEPLARLPYIPALIVWQTSTMLLYIGAIWLLLRDSTAPQLAKSPLWPLLALGFTAVFVNLTHGHNGFLTASLFAAGLALLDRRPIIAGVLFGLLVYKPQFAVLIPLALIAAAHWRTLAAAAVTAAMLTVLVTLLYGAEVWSAFLASSHFTRVVVLEQGGTGFHKIQSIFAWVRLWGGSVQIAYIMQGTVSLAVATGLIALWRSGASQGLKNAALCVAAILVTPYSLDYDLMVVAPAIAFLATEGTADGFAPWRKSLLAVLWIMPIAVRSIALVTYIPLGVAMLLVTFIAICREGLGQKKSLAIREMPVPA